MTRVSLLDGGEYNSSWISDFYDQAHAWWGDDPQEPGVHLSRVQTVARLAGPGPWRILELGAGAGHSAAALADAGHDVTAVELSPRRASAAKNLAAIPRRGRMTAVEADFFTFQLEGRFDLVCCWETFGLGADADQRHLLRRIAQDWLTPQGCALLEVYNPFKPAAQAGKDIHLDPLPGVPGSVEMIEKTHFDPLHGQWTDEWVPVEHPENALAQTIRCYSVPEFQLLLEGTGLRMDHLEVNGEALDSCSNEITPGGPLLEAWSYLVRLRPEDQ